MRIWLMNDSGMGFGWSPWGGAWRGTWDGVAADLGVRSYRPRVRPGNRAPRKSRLLRSSTAAGAPAYRRCRGLFAVSRAGNNPVVQCRRRGGAGIRRIKQCSASNRSAGASRASGIQRWGAAWSFCPMIRGRKFPWFCGDAPHAQSEIRNKLTRGNNGDAYFLKNGKTNHGRNFFTLFLTKLLKN